MNTPRLLTVAAMCSVLLTACETVPCQRGIPFQDDALAQELRQNIATLYPSSLRVLHRGILTVSGMNLELTGYVLARSPADIRLVAVNDFGGTLFEAVHTDKAGIRILNNNIRFPRRWLMKAPLRDVSVIYLKRPSGHAALARHTGNLIALVEKLEDGTTQEFHFDADTHRFTGYVLSQNDRCLYEATFSNNRIVPGWPASAIPAAIQIKDHRMNYQLIISVLKLTPDKLEDAFFD